VRIVGAPICLCRRSRSPSSRGSARVALAVTGGITEPVKEVTGRACGPGDAGLGITGNERAVVIDDVELALHGVDDDVARFRVVVERVAVQPVPPERPAWHVEVDAAG